MPFVADPGGGEAQPAAGSIGAGVAAALNPFSGDGAMSPQALEQARQAAQGLKDSAASGGFKISENAIPDLMKALNDADNQINGATQSVQNIQQAPKLGSSPYADQVASHTQKSGTGDRSASMVLEQFKEVLQLTRDALNLASKNYADNESGNVQTFNQNP